MCLSTLCVVFVSGNSGLYVYVSQCPDYNVLPAFDSTFSQSFRDIGLQIAFPVQIVIAHARYHVTCTPYVKFGYIFEFPTPTLPIHYDTFIGLR